MTSNAMLKPAATGDKAVHPASRQTAAMPADRGTGGADGEHMIGLILVTHGRLAQEFLAAMEHVVGQQGDTVAVCIGPDDDMEQRRREIIEGVRRVDRGKGVVILTDMFGGTPSNLAISVLEQGRVEVIAGINLPMLIKLASVRGRVPLAEAVQQAQEAGKKYIYVASQSLRDVGGRV